MKEALVAAADGVRTLQDMLMHPSQERWSPPRRLRPHTLSERLVAAPELRSTVLQEHIRTRMPALVARGLSNNPSLDPEVWKAVYTFKPKVPIRMALALVSHPLGGEQLEHLRREKRVLVWEQVMGSTVLEHEMVRDLGSRGLIGAHVREQGPRDIFDPSARVSPYSYTAEGAGATDVGALGGKLSGPAVNYLVEQLGGDLGAWENALALVDTFDGTLSELAGVAQNL